VFAWRKLWFSENMPALRGIEGNPTQTSDAQTPSLAARETLEVKEDAVQLSRGDLDAEKSRLKAGWWRLGAGAR